MQPDGSFWPFPSANQSGSSTGKQQISAILSQRHFNGQTVSPDDAALGEYQTYEGTTQLGAIIGTGHEGPGCFLGNEIVGKISPSNYKGQVILHRWIINDASYANNTPSLITFNADDTSEPPFRDDDPQSGNSGGKVYDLDAPGLPSEPVDGNVYRYRANFYAYAALPDGTRISPYYNYYVRVSCTDTSTGLQFVNDIPGDNQIGNDSTFTTWNLNP